jgi:hypothetical protein
MKSAKKQQDQRTEGDHWGDDDVPTVSEVIGEGEEAHRIVRVGAWEFVASAADSEPRIRDLDLAVRLEFGRPRDIRRLIRSLEAAGKLNDLHHRDGASRTGKQVAARPEKEYWLTEAQALKVVAKSETAVADALLDEVIRVFVLARKGLLPQQAPAVNPYGAEMVAVVGEVARSMIAEMVGPMRVELAALRETMIALPQGVITDMQGDRIDGKMEYVAMAMVALGEATTKKSAMGIVREDLKSAIAWGFKGSQMRRMPAAKFLNAETALEVMRKNVERRLKNKRKKVASKKQGDLFDPKTTN